MKILLARLLGQSTISAVGSPTMTGVTMVEGLQDVEEEEFEDDDDLIPQPIHRHETRAATIPVGAAAARSTRSVIWTPIRPHTWNPQEGPQPARRTIRKRVCVAG